MPHLFRRHLTNFETHELFMAKNYLRYGDGARDENGFPFAMTFKQAKSILQHNLGIFWRFCI